MSASWGHALHPPEDWAEYEVGIQRVPLVAIADVLAEAALLAGDGARLVVKVNIEGEEQGRELEHGRGIVLWRGLPVERYSDDQLRRLYWGLGTHLGQARYQNAHGELIGEVRDEVRLYGEVFHRKTELERMPGPKAMTAVSRKILKMIWGVYRSGRAFDVTRVFQCASVHAAAA